MNIRAHVWVLPLLLAAGTGSGLAVARGAQPERPETVMITLHAKAGMESDLARVIASHWTTARRLHLVLDTPHLTLRSGDGKTFVEILTWKDESVPDDAPAEIRAIWDEMNRLVEARGGAPGLTIEQVSVVSDSVR